MGIMDGQDQNEIGKAVQHGREVEKIKQEAADKAKEEAKQEAKDAERMKNDGVI